MSDHPTHTDVLADVALLAGATEDDRDRVRAVSAPCRFAPGDLLLRRGEPADHLYVLIEGRVALSLHAPGRGNLTVETLGPGDVVGVSWAVAPHRWGLDARAMTPVGAVRIDGAWLRAAMTGDDALATVLSAGVIGLLSERLQATRLRLVDLCDEERRR